jgi:hypothetical protein
MADNDSEKGDAALIVALAGGATVRDAARRAHVGERTVYRRLDEPDFRRQVQDARAGMVAQAVGKLADAATNRNRCGWRPLGQFSKSAPSYATRRSLKRDWPRWNRPPRPAASTP